MKSESTHYPAANSTDAIRPYDPLKAPVSQLTPIPKEGKPDLLQSIEIAKAHILENEALEKKAHDEVIRGKAKLKSLLALKKKYDDLLNEVSEGIIADEASGFNGEANQNTADKRPSTERRGL